MNTPLMDELKQFIKENPEGWEVKIGPAEILAVITHVQTGLKHFGSKNPEYLQIAREFCLRLKNKIPETYPAMHRIIDMGWPDGPEAT